MKNLLKKFRDFRLTAMIEGCLGLLSAICSLALLLLYQFNQVDPEDPSKIVTGFNGEPILGMMMFLFGLFALIFSIVVVYTSYPFIFKKEEKLEPNKALVWFGVTIAVLSILFVVFAFMMVGRPGSRYTVGVIIVSIFSLIASIGQLAMMYPALTVRIEKQK